MFIRLYLWFKLQSGAPSHHLTKRLVAERAHQTRRQAINMGRTFISANWTARTTVLIQPIFAMR